MNTCKTSRLGWLLHVSQKDSYLILLWEEGDRIPEVDDATKKIERDINFEIKRILMMNQM